MTGERPAKTADQATTRTQERASLRRWVLIVVGVLAALRICFLVLSLFQLWPVGGVATLALAHVEGAAGLGVSLEAALVVGAVVGTVKVASGLGQTRKLLWYGRTQLLGWAIIVDTAVYCGSIGVGLWAAGAWPPTGSDAVEISTPLVLHLPVLWASGVIILRARRLRATARPVVGSRRP